MTIRNFYELMEKTKSIEVLLSSLLDKKGNYFSCFDYGDIPSSGISVKYEDKDIQTMYNEIISETNGRPTLGEYFAYNNKREKWLDNKTAVRKQLENMNKITSTVSDIWTYTGIYPQKISFILGTRTLLHTTANYKSIDENIMKIYTPTICTPTLEQNTIMISSLPISTMVTETIYKDFFKRKYGRITTIISDDIKKNFDFIIMETGFIALKNVRNIDNYTFCSYKVLRADSQPDRFFTDRKMDNVKLTEYVKVNEPSNTGRLYKCNIYELISHINMKMVGENLDKTKHISNILYIYQFVPVSIFEIYRMLLCKDITENLNIIGEKESFKI